MRTVETYKLNIIDVLLDEYDGFTNIFGKT